MASVSEVAVIAGGGTLTPINGLWSCVFSFNKFLILRIMLKGGISFPSFATFRQVGETAQDCFLNQLLTR